MRGFSVSCWNRNSTYRVCSIMDWLKGCYNTQKAYMRGNYVMGQILFENKNFVQIPSGQEDAMREIMLYNISLKRFVQLSQYGLLLVTHLGTYFLRNTLFRYTPYCFRNFCHIAQQALNASAATTLKFIRRQ